MTLVCTLVLQYGMEVVRGKEYFGEKVCFLLFAAPAPAFGTLAADTKVPAEPYREIRTKKIAEDKTPVITVGKYVPALNHLILLGRYVVCRIFCVKITD